MASGSTTKQTDSAHILTQMDPSMRVSGSMTCKKEWARKPGKTALATRVIIAKVRSMVKATTCGAMEVYIKETGMSTRFKAMARINGLMDVSMLETGMKIKCTVTVFTHGLMVAVTKACMKMI